MEMFDQYQEHKRKASLAMLETPITPHVTDVPLIQSSPPVVSIIHNRADHVVKTASSLNGGVAVPGLM
jgi:hypothetical protein